MSATQYSNDNAPLGLEQQIEELHSKILIQEKTLVSLQAEGHESTDASRHLGSLLQQLTALISIKTTNQPSAAE